MSSTAVPGPAGLAPFRSYLPVRISFGDGVAGELAGVLQGLGATSALVLLEEPVAGIAGVADALAACESAGITLHRHLKAPGEPTFAAAEEVAAELGRLEPAALVAIGGGSALDLAKAARLVAEQGGPLTPLRRRRDAGRPSRRCR